RLGVQDDLVRPLVMSHRKLGHSSGGELQFAGWFDGATLAPFGSVELALCPLGGAVAVADVLGERVAEGVPVEVGGVLADELVDRAGGCLDPAEVAGVGRRTSPETRSEPENPTARKGRRLVRS